MTALGFGAVSLTVVAYALEHRPQAFVALFAFGCALSSAYAFRSGSLPFGGVEAVWCGVALRRLVARRMI